jgi:streptomycin 6-kinase
MAVVPGEVLANWRRWWPGEQEAIAGDVVDRLAAAIDAWQLARPRVIAGGEVAFVLAAEAPSGPVVLKLNPRATGEGAEEVRDEARGLVAWAAAGAAVPAVRGVRDDAYTILLERIEPGTTLMQFSDDPLRTMTELGGLARSLRQADLDPVGFTRLPDSELLQGWRARFAGSREATELETLVSDGTPQRLLHLDLHNKNALRHGQGFVAIDPKPLLGDPHAETFGLLRSPRPLTGRGRRDRDLVFAMLRAYAQGLDVERLAAWTRLRALAVHGWAMTFEPGWAAEMARLAEALDR